VDAPFAAFVIGSLAELNGALLEILFTLEIIEIS
jgi:hypothetical protein